ncbi:KEOPS complex component [Halorubellus sp. JP-L1]|uniref:KEOPS complex subunit Cgi121 n=1 Tax=Halorubellus sp. JP-L1 TaxID=2715753 RepID=UPI00140C6B20|nr:KEOPS complex subunit Cgi121 [Halorubellus sp. JP-L1]NHN43446.1 KEOPS complex component [Halorubellus sp. JP-L1]
MRVVEGTTVVDDLDGFVAALGDVGDAHDCVVQAFDARYVAGREHLATALRYAARAHRRGDAIARDPAVEVLLYAAGRRQIDRALAMGVSEGEHDVAVVVATDFPDAPLDERDTGQNDSDTAREERDAERECATAVADLLDAPQSLDAGETFAATDRERVREFFDVGDRELTATDAPLADLVRERVVLLSIDH